jgi:transcriptional regulator with XRE-family HTH domain
MHTPRAQYENKLWIARKKAGLEQKSVARLMGYKSVSPISEYETGRLLPSLSTALRLSIIYNTPLKELYAALYAEMEQEVSSLRKNMPKYQLMQRGPQL